MKYDIHLTCSIIVACYRTYGVLSVTQTLKFLNSNSKFSASRANNNKNLLIIFIVSQIFFVSHDLRFNEKTLYLMNNFLYIVLIYLQLYDIPIDLTPFVTKFLLYILQTSQIYFGYAPMGVCT